jgi:hypothetical protein
MGKNRSQIVLSLGMIIGLSLVVAAVVTGSESGPGTGVVTSTTIGEAERIIERNGNQVLDGVVIVKFSVPQAIHKGGSQTGLPSLDKTLRRYGVSSINRAFPLPNRALGSKGQELRRIYRIRYSSGEDPYRVARHLANNPNIEYAVPWYVHRIHNPQVVSVGRQGLGTALVPNDSLYSRMTHLAQILAPEAWDIVKGEEGEVVVAIVDGGTDWRHEDILDNVWQNLGEDADGDGHTIEWQDGGWILDPGDLNGVDDDDWDDSSDTYIDDLLGWNFPNESGDPSGLHSAPLNADHGTAVAGVASAVTDNGIGVAGSSWNALLRPINATCASDSFICYGYEGVVYAAGSGADVINASWGTLYRGLSPVERQLLLEYVGDIVDYVTECGALLISSAGNDETNNDAILSLPAGAPHVLAVGSTTKNTDEKAWFSNYGISVDVFAPGELINSTLPRNAYINNAGGTSFSSPLTAGIAALVKTRFPDLTPDQLAQQLRVTADPIDDANPTYRGALGKGRINAYRAVTDTTIPAIRIAGVSFLDSGEDGLIDNGESIDLTVALTNYLAVATNVTLALSQTNPSVTITDGEAQISFLESGETAQVLFSFDLDQVGDEQPLPFVLDISADNYADRDIFRVAANLPRVLTHDTGPLQVTITGEGNIGWTGFADQSSGVGFVYHDRNLLFEGGLLLGASRRQISDCVRGTGDALETDFDIVPGGSLTITSGQLANEEGLVTIDDQPAGSPIGLTIRQDSYADNDPDYNDFVIFKYLITNNSGDILPDLYMGIFTDWDINADAQDHAFFDSGRRMGYVQDHPSQPTNIAAIRMLTTNNELLFRAIDNPAEIYGGNAGDGFTFTEKWSYLTEGIQTQSLSAVDVSMLIGVGPMRIEAGESVEIAVAAVAANSSMAMEEHADSAQQFWESTILPGLPSHAPAFIAALPDTTISTVETLSFTYVAGDEDDDTNLSFSLRDPPENASIDSETGELTFTPVPGFVGAVTITAVVSDGMFSIVTSAEVTIEQISNLLGQNYANPLSLSQEGETRIDYHLGEPNNVKLVIYDILGREVITLVSDFKPVGKYTAYWNGHDRAGRRVSAGLYLYRLQAGDFIRTRKILVLK